MEEFIKAVKRTKKLALEVKGDILHLAAEDKKADFCCADAPKDLRDILIDETIEKHGYNLKNQLFLLANSNLCFKGLSFDLQIAQHLLHLPMEKVFLENVFSEQEILAERLKEEKLISLFQNIEMPLIEVLADIEKQGIMIKKEIFRELSEELEVRITEISREIYEIAGENFNIASPKQLGRILFAKLGLPPVKKKKTGFSTDAEVLEVLSRMHILPQKILEYREFSKLKSTYVDVLPRLIDTQDGRLHTVYHQTVTATGRLSSTNPNLQNIPIRNQWGRRLREGIIPFSKDCFLLGADYSQVELRLLAHFSKDRLLCKSFENDEDIHTQTAGQIFELERPKINTDLRRMAKMINFGIIYGMSAHGLSRNLKIEVSQAEEFISRYFEKYQGVKKYIEKTIEQAKAKGYVETMFGRRRYLPQIAGPRRQEKEFASRAAVNTPIQGTAAEIIKLAMTKMWHELKRKKMAARIILQIHDELILNVPEREINEVKKIVKAKMEGVVKLSVPLKVNLNLGRSWAEI